MYLVLFSTWFAIFIVLSNCQHLMPIPTKTIFLNQHFLKLQTQPVYFKRHQKNHHHKTSWQANNTALLEIKQVSFDKLETTTHFWTYTDGPYGPSNWHLYYPECRTRSSSMNQSPIDVKYPVDDIYVSDPFISNLVFSNIVSRRNTLKLKNTGHFLQVDLPINNGNFLSGGKLKDVYSLAYFTFHWGTSDETGSEHFINGHQYPLEIHFVYRNTKRHNLASSFSINDGVVIVAVLFDLGKNNVDIEHILRDTIPTLVKAKSETILTHKLAVHNLIPSTSNSQWISYTGSLTTPPCTEKITWIIPKDTMSIHPSQLAKLRTLTSDLRGTIPIGFNYRPIQPQNNRTQISSFEPVGKIIEPVSRDTEPMDTDIESMDKDDMPTDNDDDEDGNFMLTLTRRPGCWSYAQRDCELQGGNLVSITSQEEQNGVLSTCRRTDRSNYCWIGLTRDSETRGTRDGWYWIDGTDNTDYSSWCCKEGIGRNESQNYGIIQDDNPYGKWHDEINCPEGGLFGVCMIPIDLDEEHKKNETIDNHWDYGFLNGPKSWHLKYPTCAFTKQSPINITFPNSDFYVLDKSKPNLIFADYIDQVNSIVLQNSGLSFEIDYQQTICPHRLAGGPLLGTYNLAKIQFRWSQTDKTGSEHFINGRQYPLEIQFVYWNIKYHDFSHSLTAADGLAIVSILFNIGKKNNALQGLLQDSIPTLIAAKTKIPNLRKLSIKDLWPTTATTHWVSYQGSLTTPPCSESVTWIILKEAMFVSHGQLAELRKLTSDFSGTTPISQNYRPLQPLNGRELTTSFELASISIDIPNWSFSNPGISLKPPSNWHCGPGACAVFENDGLHGNKIAGTNDPYLLFINSHTHNRLVQTIPKTYSANKAYVLTVGLAGRVDNPGSPLSEVSLSISLCYSDCSTCLGSTEITYGQLSNYELRDFTYTTPVLTDMNSAIDNQIIIVIETVGLGESGGDWTIDNVRLHLLAPAHLSRSKRILTLTPQRTCWSQARVSCQAMGGDLVSIATREEQQQVFEKCEDSDRSNSCWIGLVRDKKTKGQSLEWQWTDNTQSGFDNWSKASDTGGNYGVILNNPLGEWHDAHDCAFEKFGICAIPRDFVFTLTTRKYCWTEALLECRSQGGDLASIASEEEQNQIITTCRKAKDGSNCWLGLKRNISVVNPNDGRTGWTWVDGTENTDFRKWSPSTRYVLDTRRNYATVNVNNKFGHWENHGECEQKFYGVCIMPRIKEISPSYYVPCPHTQSPTTLSPTTLSPTLAPTTLTPTTLAPTSSPTSSPTSPTPFPTPSPTGCAIIKGFTAFPNEVHPRGKVVDFFSLSSCANHCNNGCIGFHWVQSTISDSINGVCFHWGINMAGTAPSDNACLYIKDEPFASLATKAPTKISKDLLPFVQSPTMDPIKISKSLLPHPKPPTKVPIKIKKGLDLTLTLTKNSSNWFDARRDCQHQGGDLASITSQEEQDAMLSKCRHAKGENSCWIGLRRGKDINEHDIWYWVDGTQDFRYQAWSYKKKVDQRDRQDFVIIEDDDKKGKWHSIEGYPKKGFFGICLIPHKAKFNPNFDLGFEDFGNYEESWNPTTLLGNQQASKH